MSLGLEFGGPNDFTEFLGDGQKDCQTEREGPSASAFGVAFVAFAAAFETMKRSSVDLVLESKTLSKTKVVCKKTVKSIRGWNALPGSGHRPVYPVRSG